MCLFKLKMVLNNLLTLFSVWFVFFIFLGANFQSWGFFQRYFLHYINSRDFFFFRELFPWEKLFFSLFYNFYGFSLYFNRFADEAKFVEKRVFNYYGVYLFLRHSFYINVDFNEFIFLKRLVKEFLVFYKLDAKKKCFLGPKINFVNFYVLRLLLTSRSAGIKPYYNICAINQYQIGDKWSYPFFGVKHTFNGESLINAVLRKLPYFSYSFYYYSLLGRVSSNKKKKFFINLTFNKFHDTFFGLKFISAKSLYVPNRKKVNIAWARKIWFTYLTKTKKTYKKLYSIARRENIFTENVMNKLKIVYENSSYFSINSVFFKKLKKVYCIRFSESSINKFLLLPELKKYNFYFLRKNRIFNKSRYSRNRQLYRTGVYWCLWLNIMIVYGLYFFFYRFVFTFNYMWWFFCFFIFSLIFGRVVQSRLYNISNLFGELVNFISWLGFFFNYFVEWFLNIYSYSQKHIIESYYIRVFLDSNFFSEWYGYILGKLPLFSLDYITNHNKRFIYFWEYFEGIDTSFLKYKTVIHWFRQCWKMLTTY